jgi:FkbM family methyltransferase
MLRTLVGYIRPLTNYFTYTTRSGMASGLKRKGGMGFMPRRLTEEERFYQSLDLRGKIVYDIGSYEGIFSLFAARAVGPTGRLIVCEPNPESFRRTSTNLQLNNFGHQPVIHNIALGKELDELTMFYPVKEPARATLDTTIAEAYREHGELLSTCVIKVTTLDALVTSRLQVPDFIKIDTEGFELNVLKGGMETLAAFGPDLFMELHGSSPANWRSNRAAIHALLDSLGYETLNMDRQPVVAETQNVSHLYCTKQIQTRRVVEQDASVSDQLVGSVV